jgi:hypothetical protein
MSIKVSENGHEKFLETWRLVQTNQRMFQYWLKKYPFSIFEKKLLKCFNLYQKNKKEEALKLLNFNIKENPLLEGLRYYLKGLIYNQHGHYFYAVENLNQSIENFKKIKDCSFVINSICLLVNIYANRRDLSKLKESAEQLSRIKPQNDSQKLQKMYAEMCVYSITGQIQKCEQLYLDFCEQDKSQIKIYKPYFLVCLFSAYAAELEYDRCKNILDDYKKISGCVVKANYLYMKTLLDHVISDAPLYFYAKDFKDFPELYLQLKVIKALKSGNLEEAKKSWLLLSKHNEFLYLKNFDFQGEKSLFKQALDRHKNNIEKVNIDLKELNSLRGNLKKVEYIFSKVKVPIQNEELIRLIWDEELTEVTLNRLRKLISDYVKKHKVSIKASDATYRVVDI